jgi:predicted  nucleic acid-binding Zn-ribbon protein
MLAEFDQAKHELSKIANELENDTDDNNRDRTFLRSRARDVLRRIYVDSPATVEHISEMFSRATNPEVLATIKEALKLGPPIRLALSSEDDGRTVQALIDSALWRSKSVRFCIYAVIILILVALALLGVNVAEISKQANSARELVADANAKLEQMKTANRVLEEKQYEVEGKSKVIFSRIDAARERLDNPNDDVNKIAIRFETQLTRLGDLEQEWSRRREKLTDNLAQHEVFLAGREDQTIRKVTEFNNQVSEHASAVEAIVNRTRNFETTAAKSAANSKESAETIAPLIGPAQSIAMTLQALRDQTREIANSVRQDNDKIADVRRLVEATRNSLDPLAESAKEKLNAALQFTNSLSLWQTTASQHLDRIREIEGQAVNRTGEINRVAAQIGNLQSEIVAKIEDAKTTEQRLKGEVDRVRLDVSNIREIITVVEDKRADIVSKLHRLLDERPSMDSALVWKLILGSQTLILLIIGVLGLLSILIIVQIFIFITLRRQRNALNALTQR